MGYCVGVLRPDEFTFTSTAPPRLGEFVIASYRDGEKDFEVLGIVSRIERFDRFLHADNYPEHVETIRKISPVKGVFKTRVTVLGELGHDGSLKRLKYPPMPGAPVFSAPASVLKRVFGNPDDIRTAKIGTLLTSESVEVGVDINQIVSRHLAVLAVTGGGKSNAVSVLLEEMAKKRITALIVDVHGEYVDADFYGPNGERITNPIDVRIDLTQLSASDIATISGIDFERSNRQYYVLMEVVDRLKEARKGVVISDVMDINPFEEGLPSGPPFIEHIICVLRALIRRKSSKAWDEGIRCGSLSVEDLERHFGDFVDVVEKQELIGTYIRLVNLKGKLGERLKDNATPIVDIIGGVGLGKINVLDLRGFDYEAMDVVVSHTLLSILKERKRYVQTRQGKLPLPVLVVIEEAHIFAPKGVSTKTKYALSKVAREARKFGVGLALVSQRPKGLDENVLSQMNNWIILRIVEPEDQRHVQRASETLSADLLQYLPSLNPGEAILIGPFVKVPLLVKFRLSQARKAGHDIDVVGESLRFFQGN